MAFLPAEIIKKKRNASSLTNEEIHFMINGYSKGEIPDYQMSAWLMSIYFQGMKEEETLALTKSMLHSGKVVDFSDMPVFKVDKHSTGGVGDKTSLVLGPIVAAAGLAVPMISGRGLGHTGGTLDKLESIPGFNTQLGLENFKTLIKKHLICFIGQTAEICPADKKIYALRDVTATVDSIPLICASILSKKLAEGIDGLVLDVKYGSGSFMKEPQKSEELATKLIAIAKSYGKKAIALLTNMDQPLGRYSGNSLEVQECIDILQNKTPEDPIAAKFQQETEELSVELSAYMLLLGQAKNTLMECRDLAREMLTSGKAYKKFLELCEIHSGDLSKLPLPKNQQTILATEAGYMTAMETEQIGLAGILLKAGRAKTDDLIEPTAGIEFHAKTGDRIVKGQKLFTVYGADPKLFPVVIERLQASVKISDSKINPSPLILKVIT